MSKSVQAIIEEHPVQGKDQLIPLLQDIQTEQGYISRQAVAGIGEYLDLPASKIYGVATFYNQFRFSPLGKFHVQVCRGTACHVKGSQGIFAVMEKEMGIKAGETSRDGFFSLEVVACLGACGLAPLICVNGEFHGEVTADSVVKILRRYRRKATA